MISKIDSVSTTKPFQVEYLATYQPQQPRWYKSWQRDVVRSLLSDLINENIRKLREEHTRLSKEMAIQRHNFFLDLKLEFPNF